MKKRKLFVFASVFFAVTLLAGAKVALANAKIDVTKGADGIVKYEYTGDLSKTDVRAMMELPGIGKINPRMYGSPSVLPLSMGTGSYKLTIAEVLPDGKGRPLSTETFALTGAPDEKVMFTISNMDINFDASKVCIPEYKKLTGGLSGNDVTNKLWEEVVNNYTYDYDKAKAVVNKTLKNYLPDIDTIYDAKKGICYDYSAVLGGALRSQGIPVKMCKGYAADVGEYHAWNEILVDGKWVVVDSTVDASYAAAGVAYKFEKDASKYKATSYS